MGLYDDIFERPPIGGRYKFIRRLGAGAFGEVFLAHQELAGVPGVKFRTVAIKLFKKDYVTRENAEEIFSEALLVERMAEKVRAEGKPVHLVTTFDLGVFMDLSATPFVAMECVYGSLEKELAKAPSLPLMNVIGHLRGICGGLKLVHGHSPAVVHRDLKPANILIEESSFHKVADFGLAIDRMNAMVSGGQAGTISYSPPEARGEGVPTPAFDIYSLGVIMLEMMMRNNPLERALSEVPRNPAEIHKALNIAQARLAELRDPADGAPLTEKSIDLRTSPAAQEILRRCLAVDPSRRYHNATELDEALAAIEADRFVPQPAAREETGRERMARLLEEADAMLRLDEVGEADRRLEQLAPLAPREEKYFVLLSRVREKQSRWREAVNAQKEVNAMVASRRRDGRADPALIERLASLYERSGKTLAAQDTRRALES